MVLLSPVCGSIGSLAVEDRPDSVCTKLQVKSLFSSAPESQRASPQPLLPHSAGESHLKTHSLTAVALAIRFLQRSRLSQLYLRNGARNFRLVQLNFFPWWNNHGNIRCAPGSEIEFRGSSSWNERRTTGRKAKKERGRWERGRESNRHKTTKHFNVK